MKSTLLLLLVPAGRPPGELTGARPSGKRLTRPRAQVPARRAAAANPVQQRLLNNNLISN